MSGRGNQRLDRVMGEHLREGALRRVEQHNETLVARARVAIRAVALRAETFTTDEVWMEMRTGAEGEEPRAMGAAMRNAERDGIVEGTKRTRQSARPGCHLRPCRVWRSLLIVGPPQGPKVPAALDAATARRWAKMQSAVRALKARLALVEPHGPPTIERASGEALCPLCALSAADHPDHPFAPSFTILCDGSMVKL